jgi:hypothetical protein
LVLPDKPIVVGRKLLANVTGNALMAERLGQRRTPRNFGLVPF